MQFHHLQAGRFLRRYKRFLVDLELPDGQSITVHCPNTGAMTGCTEPGARAWFSESANPKRKYRHTLEWLELASGERVCINTQRPNQLVREAIEQGTIAELQGYASLQSEVVYGCEGSRADFMLSNGEGGGEGTDAPCFVEVKNVTLLENGVGYFPDAISLRALRHLRELVFEKARGNRAVLIFCVNHTAIRELRPAQKIHYDYAQLLRDASHAGLEILAYRTAISPQEIRIVAPVPVRLSGT